MSGSWDGSLRIAILSDVHANYAALDAVLRDAQTRGVQAYWFLGDAVGRGTQPVETILRLRQLFSGQPVQHQHAWLSGNHDLLVLERVETEFYDRERQYGGGQLTVEAHEVAHRHRIILKANDPGHLKWLYNLPTYANPFAGVYMAHGETQVSYPGSLEEAVEAPPLDTYNEYTLTLKQVREAFEQFQASDMATPRLILNGHTHVPWLVTWSGNTEPMHEVKDLFREEGHYFNMQQAGVYINPGSVGFARLSVELPLPRNEGDKLVPHYPIFPTYVLLNVTPDFSEGTIHFLCVPYDKSRLEISADYPAKFREELDGQTNCPS